MGQLIRRILYAIRRRRREADLAEELEFHRAMKQRELEERGLASTDAVFGARRALGNDALARNLARDVWIWPWLQDTAQDVGFAARLLVKDLRFTLAAVTALALGIAANTTVFTFINTALFKDLPFDEPRELVAVASRDKNGRELQVSYLDFQDWERATRTFTGLAASTLSAMNLSDEQRAPERLRGAYVSANALELLRVKPVLGRGFLADDEHPGATPVTLLGDGVWKSRYGGDPGVVGQTVRVNDVPSIVIGIMPPRFSFPATAEVWQPLRLAPGVATAKRNVRTLAVIGRLAKSVTADQAQADLSAIAARLAEENPATNLGITPAVAPPLESQRRFVRPTLMTLMGAVGFVLLIACANVANLLLARASHRSREIAIRASLGATRWRIVRQLLIECLLLATCAGVLGLVLSVYGVRYFGVAFDVIEVGAPERTSTPYWVNLAMDRSVFVFVAALCLGTSLVFGLAPALHVLQTNVHDVLKESSRSTAGNLRARRSTAALMIVELALTLILLSGGGLLVRTFVTHYRMDQVIDTTNLLTVRLGLPLQKYSTPEQQKTFFARLDQRLASNATLASVALAGDIPLVSLGSIPRRLSINGRPPATPDDQPLVSSVYVGPRYFETVGLRASQGRTFAAGDGAAGQESAIVDQRFAARFFSNEDPLGRRIQIAVPNADTPVPWLTIVGVVPTLPSFGPSPPRPLVYVPAAAETGPIRFISVIVGSGPGGPAAAAALLREEVRALDSDLPLYAIQTIDDAIARTRFPLRLMGTLFGLLAVIALVLSSVGLYALTAYGVAQRTQEIGVRMALGARGSQMVWLFVRRTLVQLAAGVAVGLGGALAIGRLLQTLIRDTDPRDPITLACVTTLLVGVAVTASVLPSRRAARLDPVTALRHE